MALGLCLILFGAIGTVAMVRRADREARRLAAVCRRAAMGDFEARVLSITDVGSMGSLAWSINDMIDRYDAYVRESSAAMSAVRDNKYYRRILPEGLHGSMLAAATTINDATAAIEARVGALNRQLGEFETSTGAIVQSLTGEAAEMGDAAQILETGSAETRERVTAIAAASEQATANMQTVAAATTELSTSARDIGEKVERSARIVQDAVSMVVDADRKVQHLSEAAAKIGAVIELIDSVAAQTNLLALNATIEAARAGEAGRGFAVVAQEVKALAGQTSRATGEIAGHIAEVQTSTKSAVDAITQIGTVMSEVDQITAHVSTAVSAQAAATDEIGHSIEQAFGGIREIAANINAVTRNATATATQATGTRRASNTISEQGRVLAEAVKSFIVSLRRGPLDRRHRRDESYRGPERRSAQRPSSTPGAPGIEKAA